MSLLLSHLSFHTSASTPQLLLLSFWLSFSLSEILPLINKITDLEKFSPLEPSQSTAVGETVSEVEQLVRDQALLAQSYGKPGIGALLRSRTVVLSAWAAAMCGFLYGFDQGQMNVTLNVGRFLDHFPQADPSANHRAAFWKGLVTAIFELGAVLGALQSAFFCDMISRRYTIFVATAWYLVGAVLQSAARDYAMLVVGRFVGGVGVGAASMIAPLYIAEIAQPNIRGSLYTLQQWMLILGIVVAYYVTYGSRNLGSDWAWRASFVAQILPGLILAAIVFFLPFSPRWLAVQDRSVESLNTISWLRSLPPTDPRVQAEWIGIRCDVALQRRLAGLDTTTSTTSTTATSTTATSRNPFSVARQWARWTSCFSPRYRTRIAIVVILNTFQQWVGVNGFTYYSTELFSRLGYGPQMRLTLGGLLSVTQLVGSTVPVFVIDHVGRRPLLLFGTFMLMSCQLITGTAISTSYHDWASHQPSAKAGTAFMFIFMFCFEISWGPIAWGLPSEILPSSIRAEGMAFAAASNWLNNFIVGLVVPAIVDHAPYASFALFACTSFVALVWVYFFVPETKQKTLEDLSGVFNDGANEVESTEHEAILSAILNETAA